MARRVRVQNESSLTKQVSREDRSIRRRLKQVSNRVKIEVETSDSELVGS